MDELKEWENHVIKSANGRGFDSYCGVYLSMPGFYLMDKEHAIGCVNQDTRVQPCPRCYEEIVDNG